MKKLSFNLSVLLLLTFCNSSIAQISQPDKSYYPVPDHPEWFKTIPLIDESTPDWAILMYESDIDFNRIETLKTRYYRLHPFEKTIHTQNYKYWYKTVKDYIDDNGHVNLPVAGEVYSRYESLKRTNPKHYRSESAIWQNIGPNNTYINNGSLEVRPTQANVYCLGVAPSNPSIVYAGMETGGVFKSVDKGLSWFPVTNDYAIGNIHDIKVDPLDPDIVYASRDKELYKSIDGGTTWNLQYLSSARIEQLYIHSSVTDTLYAATADGLLKSPDGGASWSSKFSGRLYDIEVKPGTDSIFYVAVENTSLIRPEIWKSTDYGNTWTLMDNGYYIPSDLSVAQVNGCKIGVTPADPNRVYAGIIATGKTGDNGWIGIYYSLDEGATWQEDSGFDGGPYASGNDPSTNWYVAGYSSGYHQGFYNFDIDVSHNDPDKLWIGTIWFCESGNKGGNIEYIRGTRSLEMHADIQDIDVVGDDIWIASDGGINYSDDECQTVEVRMNGITASDYWGWGQGWNEDTWVGGRYHNGNAAFHENYGAGNTLFLGGAETPTGYVNPFDNRKMYMSDISDKLIPTSLSSTSTNISNLGLYPTQGYYHFNFSEVEWDPRYANHVYVGKEKTLFKSIDGGSTFDTLYTFPGDMRRFEISRKKPDYIYAIIYIDYWTWKIYKSSDGGSSFTELPAPSLTGGSWRNLSFTLNPFNEEEIWLASNSSSNGNKIFQSINGGGTWVNKYSGLIQDQKIKDLLYHPSPQGDLVYALTDDNFFYYSVNENTWTQYNSGFPIQHTGFLISPFYRDNKIRVPSAKGIWEAPLVNNSTIQAMPMVLKDKIYCSRDTVRFESFSILNADGATFTWSFPGAQYVDDPTLRNPKVVYGNNGVYDVTLTITQLDGQTDTKTIAGMIVVDSDCEPDRIAGDALNLDGASSDYVTIPALNQSFNEFTIAGWIKRNGDQPSYAGIFFSRGSKGIGLNFRDNNQLGYHPYYWWNSGHTVPDNEWTHVALVFEGNQTAIYMNGIRASRNSNDTPLPFDASLYIGADPNFGSRRFNGQIDEVNIWSRALTQDEIR
ncbi:MAG: hypothetical protein HKN68_20740, partial [Saprospiraceae bacterium]|nr:hypothetical protein [Saprospiraceae bacterium]